MTCFTAPGLHNHILLGCNVQSSQCSVLAYPRFVYDILHGVDIIMAAFPAKAKPAADAAAKQTQGGPAQSMEIIIDVTNAGLVLPASSRSAACFLNATMCCMAASLHWCKPQGLNSSVCSLCLHRISMHSSSIDNLWDQTIIVLQVHSLTHCLRASVPMLHVPDPPG